MYCIILSLLIYCVQSDIDDFDRSIDFDFDCSPNEVTTAFDYGFVIDAGSTGSRIYGFQWAARISSNEPYSPPNSKPKMVGDALKLGPVSGITSLQDAYDLLTPLFNHAKQITENVSDLWDMFPVGLKATAGLRMLDTEERLKIFYWIREVFEDKNVNPFKYHPSYVIIASGSEEALFDWLSVNYLLDTLEKEDELHTFGSLDLGGASTQIAFAPQDTFDIIDDFMSTNPFEYPWRIFATSHLGYGKNELERQIAAKVYVERNNVNPCLLSGTTKTYDFIRVNYSKIYNVKQIGDADKSIHICEQYLHDIIYLKYEHECLFDNGRECSINGQYLPPIPPDMQWAAFDNFGSFIADTPGVYEKSTLAEIYDVAVNDICMLTLEELNDKVPGLKEPEKMCIMDLYIVVLLRDGYGFDVTKRNILFSNTINKEPAGWQWGSILYDANMLPYKVDCEHSSHDRNTKIKNSLVDTQGYVTGGVSEMHVVVIFLFFITAAAFCFIGLFIGNKLNSNQNVHPKHQYM